MTYQQFITRLRAFGATDVERAHNAAIPLRTFKEYKAGRLPASVTRLHPDLLRALANDLEQQVNLSSQNSS